MTAPGRGPSRGWADLPQILPEQEMSDAYYDAYCAAARMRLSTRSAARTWYSLGVAAEVAGAWARHDFTPDQGWQLMNRDLTPEAAATLYREAQP